MRREKKIKVHGVAQFERRAALLRQCNPYLEMSKRAFGLTGSREDLRIGGTVDFL